MNLTFSRIAKVFVIARSWLKVCGPYNHGCAPRTPGVVLEMKIAHKTRVDGECVIAPGMRTLSIGIGKRLPVKFMPPSP